MIPFIGTIIPVAFNFAPKNWALCNGQLLSITQNQALFSVIGTSFGGNGTTNFQLPDLRGRTPSGASVAVGAISGTENVTLQLTQIPSHNHSVTGTTTVSTSTSRSVPASGQIFGTNKVQTETIFAQPSSPVYLSGSNIGYDGSGAPHDNMQPYLVVNFIIALSGIYPSRS